MRPIHWIAAATLLSGSAALTQDRDSQIPVRDLGVKQMGEEETLRLTAQNLNCPNPQDFEFQTDNMPWLNADAPLIVRNLGPGESRSIKAKLDFRYMTAGVHYGRVTSRCITCGWYVFSACGENAQDIVLKVTVAKPSNATATQSRPAINPYAGMAPHQPFQIALSPPINDDNIRRLGNGDRKELIKARGRLNAAKIAGQKAQTDLSNAQRKKSDCERKLARLKAEAAAAERAAAVARQAAKNATITAKAMNKALKNFKKDNKKALKRVDITKNNVLTASKYRGIVEREDGTGSGRYKRAQEQVDRLNEIHFEALKDHTAISKSYDARKSAADKANADAAAAAANAKRLSDAAKAAQNKVKTQIKICGGHADAVIQAQDTLTIAKSAAADAVRVANQAEAAAAKNALKKLDEEIKRKKKQCEKGRSDAKLEMDRWLEAMEAGQKLKILGDDGGRAVSTLKKVNDKMWKTAESWAESHTIVSADDKGALSLKTDATPETILGTVTSAMNLALDGMEKIVKGAGSVADFSQGQMLTGLQAVGLAVQSQINAIRNPGTYGAQRNRMLAEIGKKDSYHQKEMKEKGIGKNSKDRNKILGRVTKLFNNKNLISELIVKNGKHAAKCAAELRKLEQQRDALAKRVKGR